jgi:hypothetical protein
LPLSDFLNVSITTSGPAPTQPGFGVPMILGSCKNATAALPPSAPLKYYSSTAAMLTDGFLATDPEYLYAASLLAQNPAPPQFAVGRRYTNPPTQKFVFTVLNAVVGKAYTVVVNGVPKTFVAVDTVVNNVAIGLAAAIGTPSGFGAAVAATSTVTITASAAGNWARISALNPNVDLDCQQTHVDAGITADIANIYTYDSSGWYAVLSTYSCNAEVAALAAWTESNGKLYVADSNDSTILGAGSSDIASTLKTSAYVRTPVWYHQDNGAALAAGVSGVNLPKTPGSETWKFITPAGVAAQTFTATQITNLTTKRANYLYTVAGINMTAEGITPSGQYIDTVRGRDWLISRIQNRIFTVLTTPPSAVNPANPQGSVPLSKVPFTDQGIAVVEAELRGALQEGVNNGFLAASPSPVVSVPKASAVTTQNKSTRTLAPVSFSATIAGAIHGLTITGVVSF